MSCCSEVDSEGDEIDDETYESKVAAAGDDSAMNYYVWYAVSIDVSPTQPRDTLNISCPCLVSTPLYCILPP